MSIPKSSISACRHCQFYQSEGRRGGLCSQLGVPVQGCWKSCSLAIPPFAAVMEEPQRVMSWSVKAPEPIILEAVLITSDIKHESLILEPTSA